MNFNVHMRTLRSYHTPDRTPRNAHTTSCDIQSVPSLISPPNEFHLNSSSFQRNNGSWGKNIRVCREGTTTTLTVILTLNSGDPNSSPILTFSST